MARVRLSERLPFEQVLAEEIAETRTLLERLEANLKANPERLSVANLNQAVARLLRNQALVLGCFDRLFAAPVAEAAEATEAVEAVAVPADEDTASAVESEARGLREDAPAAVSKEMAERAVRVFDNQELSYEKGLGKIRRWIEGGTPIQMRGDLLFLRVEGCGAGLLETLLANVTRNMGYSRRLGKLEVEGIDQEVWLFEK